MSAPATDNTSVIIVTPDWVTQAWAACSVSCGQGVKERQVRRNVKKIIL